MKTAPITGVAEAGLITTVFPAATGPTAIPAKIASGKFHGGMTTPVPIGTGWERLSSPG